MQSAVASPIAPVSPTSPVVDWDSLFHLASSPPSLFSPRPTAKAQMPTPPLSHTSSQPDDQDDAHDEDPSTVVSVSTSFHPSANLDDHPPDVCLLSSDSVFFYVHSHRLLALSTNAFNHLLSSPPIPGRPPVIHIPEHSAELNVLLLTAYNISAEPYSPPMTVVASCVDSLMCTYGFRPSTHIAPHTPLYSLIVRLASSSPLDCYALAARHDLHELAVSISPFLLSYSLADITDEAASRIGPTYLKRLFFLHLGRTEALKRILLPPPTSHMPTPTCDFVEQKRLTRAWALATAYLAWEAKPDISTSSIEAALRPLGDRLACEQCRLLLRERVNTLVVQWSVIKRTI